VPQYFEILLVEDNEADVALVRRALQQHDVPCVLRIARDGGQAIEWIDHLDADPAQRPFDLMLLDMHLPTHDGEEILQRLRSTEHCAQIPVIVMTARDASAGEETAIRNAALFFFPKPSTLDEFMELGGVVLRILKASPERVPGGKA
jgi:CheY-like chemotaxis protein